MAVRAPLQIKPRGDIAETTYIDLFLKNATPGERVQTLVVRGSITVPTEGKKINLPDSHAALVATDELISKLLGDAENPAHTQWNERAEKLRFGWEGGGSALRRDNIQEHHVALVAAAQIMMAGVPAFAEFRRDYEPRRRNQVARSARVRERRTSSANGTFGRHNIRTNS